MSSPAAAAAAASPFLRLAKIIQLARDSGIRNANAMCLCTCSAAGHPSSRMVLLKGGLEEQRLTFFTNYESRKGMDLAANPRVSVVFYWRQLHQQVRVEGTVTRASTRENDEYFASRPRGSQLGCHASQQSKKVENRQVLEARTAALETEFTDVAVPRPEYWGGFHISPSRFEFWHDREDRLHDREVYEPPQDDSYTWIVHRIQP